MAITATSSPLTTAANNIVKISLRSKQSLPRAQSEFEDFSKFLSREKLELQKLELPNKRKIRELSNISIVNNFGSAGNLLSNLLSGAFDLGNFVSGFFPGKGEKIGEQPNKSKPQPKPKLTGNKINLGGVRALGILNAVFAGLDFATGISQGESAGKAGAGAGGSLVGGLAGSLAGGALAGAIAGQLAVPIPGLGLVLGATVGGLGSFLGGYAGDRAYEGITGEAKKEQKEKLNKSNEKFRSNTISNVGYSGGFDAVLDEFSSAVEKFENFAMNIGNFVMGGSLGSEYSPSEEIQEYGEYPDRQSSDYSSGDFQSLEADGGVLPSGKMNSGYMTKRRPNHKGTDYAMPEGTPISVIQPGTITRAGWFDGYGYGVQVNHPGGINSFYGHLSSINVKVGQFIDPGTVIGKVGNTGRSTGPHLHFEVDANGRSKVDPTNYADKIFRFGGNVKVKQTNAPVQNATPPPNQNRQTTSTSTTQPPKPAVATPPTTQPQPPRTSTLPLPQQSPKPMARPMPQNVMVAPPKAQPRIQSYPSYSQGQSYLLDRQTIISVGDNGASTRQAPVLVPTGGGSSPTVIVNNNGNNMLNIFMKSILLTSLSSS